MVPCPSFSASASVLSHSRFQSDWARAFPTSPTKKRPAKIMPRPFGPRSPSSLSFAIAASFRSGRVKLFDQLPQRPDVFVLSMTGEKILLTFLGRLGLSVGQHLLRYIDAERIASGVFLPCDLAFPRKEPVDVDFCRVGMGGILEEGDVARSRPQFSHLLMALQEVDGKALLHGLSHILVLRHDIDGVFPGGQPIHHLALVA